MRRRLLASVVLLPGLGWLLTTGVPGRLGELELFRVEEVRVEGTRYLPEEEARRVLALPPGATVWTDLDALAARLRAHPLVREARVRRRLPHGLVVQVREWEPVALLATPVVVPVDEEGRILPIDPSRHRLDLPLLVPGGRGDGDGVRVRERRIMARAVAQIREVDGEFYQLVSDVALEAGGDLAVRAWAPPVTLLLRPSTPPYRVEEGLRVLRDALARFGGEGVAEVDLRFEDQVVVRLNPTGS